MKTYLYAGGFAAFLSAAAAALRDGLGPDECGFLPATVRTAPDLFAEPTPAPADEQAALGLWEELERAAGIQTRRLVRLAHAHAWDGGRDGSVFACLVSALRHGRDGFDRLSDPRLLAARKRAERVLLETHRFQGLVRLRRTSAGPYYSPFNPDHDILAFLAPHFSRRYRDQTCILHDLRRAKAAVCRDGRTDFLDFSAKQPECRETAPAYQAAEDEPYFQRLWQDYFSAIALRERRNPSLQRQHVPLRYREFLIEFE